jgi:hypothetical protein
MSVETVQTQSEPSNDLDSPIWSVISFERIEAAGLDYASASRLIAELENKKVAGLCIVTNEAAARIKTPE